MRRSIDVGNYTTVPTPNQVKCLLGDGYDTAIVGCSYGSVAGAQLDAFRLGGMAVEAYAWISFKDGWQSVINRAFAVIDGRPIHRLWLDAEEDPCPNVIQRITDAVAYVEASRPNLEIGIYTGGWWWKPQTGDWHGMSHLPLWTADYRTPQTGQQPALYGGWTKAAIWQYAGSVDTCGLNTDRNVMLEGDDAMTPAEKAQMDALATAVFDQQRQINELKGYAWRDATRINVLDKHTAHPPVK